MFQIRRYLLFSLLLNLNCFSQSKTIAVSNIRVFSELSGYVRYFYPSDEASQIDWNSFIIYGIQQVKDIRDNDSLCLTLKDLFTPIAPAIEISVKPIKRDLVSVLTPSSINGFEKIFWQHLGVRGNIKNDTYRSKRSNRLEVDYVYSPVQTNLFEYELLIGDCINKQISDNLFCEVPTCLYGNLTSTYPYSDTKNFEKLKSNIAKVNTIDTNSVYNDLACVVIIDNIFRHFYPYREKLTNWDKLIDSTLHVCLNPMSYLKFIETLKILTSNLNDGHSNVWSSILTLSYFPKINLKNINDTLIITDVLDNKYNDIISKGDIILSIDGEDADIKLKTIKNMTSGSTRYKEYFSVINILKGKHESSLHLRVKHNNQVVDITLSRDLDYSSFSLQINKNAAFTVLGKDKLFLNFSKIPEKSIDSLLLGKKDYKAIICDLRGYPNSNHGILSHFLRINDTCKKWFLIPQILYPDFYKVTFESSGWKLPSLEPKIKSHLYFLIDNSVISYGESFMSIVKHYKLGTIIGDTTAGTNGNLNSYELPSYLNFSWTGMKVLTLSGEVFDQIGIAPNIRVKYSIEGIKNDVDEILAKAIEISNSN